MFDKCPGSRILKIIIKLILSQCVRPKFYSDVGTSVSCCGGRTETGRVAPTMPWQSMRCGTQVHPVYICPITSGGGGGGPGGLQLPPRPSMWLQRAPVFYWTSLPVCADWTWRSKQSSLQSHRGCSKSSDMWKCPWSLQRINCCWTVWDPYLCLYPQGGMDKFWLPVVGLDPDFGNQTVLMIFFLILCSIG